MNHVRHLFTCTIVIITIIQCHTAIGIIYKRRMSKIITNIIVIVIIVVIIVNWLVLLLLLVLSSSCFRHRNSSMLDILTWALLGWQIAQRNKVWAACLPCPFWSSLTSLGAARRWWRPLTKRLQQHRWIATLMIARVARCKSFCGFIPILWR